MSEIEGKERQTKPDFREVGVQNCPECQDVAVQTHGEAETTGKSVTAKASCIKMLLPAKYYKCVKLDNYNIPVA